MSIRLILITHEDVGAAMLSTVEQTFGSLPLLTTVVAIKHSTDIDVLVPHLEQLVKDFSQEQGILILTDMYGATPSNIAIRLKALSDKVHVISGLNLPMLMRVMNYAHLTLEEIAEKALRGGKDGVVDCGDLEKK